VQRRGHRTGPAAAVMSGIPRRSFRLFQKSCPGASAASRSAFRRVR
jgi:hypothetical protein